MALHLKIMLHGLSSVVYSVWYCPSCLCWCLCNMRRLLLDKRLIKKSICNDKHTTLPKANRTADKNNKKTRKRDFLFYIKLLNTWCLLVHYKIVLLKRETHKSFLFFRRDYQTTQNIIDDKKWNKKIRNLKEILSIVVVI